MRSDSWKGTGRFLSEKWSAIQLVGQFLEILVRSVFALRMAAKFEIFLDMPSDACDLLFGGGKMWRSRSNKVFARMYSSKVSGTDTVDQKIGEGREGAKWRTREEGKAFFSIGTG